MMGRQQRIQKKLFYTKFNLDQRVPKNHILRKVAKYIDFDFIYKEVKGKYGSNGNVSVPPAVILKMMLLLVFYNVRSERELMNTIPVRLDWLWFLGYDLDDEIPNHSVLSKARTRWGVAAFRSFFERIVIQCVHAGLVDGSKLFMDARNHQPCNYAVSYTKLIPNLNLAEGRNSITGSQPKVRSFSSSISNGFTELKKARITGFAVHGDTPRTPVFFLSFFLF